MKHYYITYLRRQGSAWLQYKEKYLTKLVAKLIATVLQHQKDYKNVEVFWEEEK